MVYVQVCSLSVVATFLFYFQIFFYHFTPGAMLSCLAKKLHCLELKTLKLGDPLVDQFCALTTYGIFVVLSLNFGVRLRDPEQ